MSDFFTLMIARYRISWTECQLLREDDADGHQDQWALMISTDFTDFAQLKQQTQWGATIRERHRLLKCFDDLSDFHSRCLCVITAQVVSILLSYTLRKWQLWRSWQKKVGAPKAQTAPAADEPSPPVRRDLPPARLHANTLGCLQSRTVGTGTVGPGQGSGQNPEVERKFLERRFHDGGSELPILRLD
jgi:hypothetical protein